MRLSDGHGGFETAPGSPFAVGIDLWGVEVGDVNSDDKQDIVTSDQESNNISILLGPS